MALIHSVIREEINVIIDKLQPQLDSLKVGLKDCKDKVVDVEHAHSGTKERMNEMETACNMLQRENKELRVKNWKTLAVGVIYEYMVSTKMKREI